MTNADVHKYKKHELRDHIFEIPDTYIGSVEKTPIETFVIADGQMVKKQLTIVPGLYKIFDEVLVNALDQCTRLSLDNAQDDIRPVKTIKIEVDKATGYIEVWNDGDGIPVEQHPEYKEYVPALIFGQLLTSSNYNKSEEKLVGGKNGYGAKLANIFSKEFIVETIDHRRKRIFTQRFHNNMKDKDAAVVKACSKVPYTKIRFLPDYQRFGLNGLTDDMYDLLKKRAYDACACTDAKVSVFFNGEKLEYKSFEQYVELYLGNKADHPRVYEKVNDRWEVVATYSDSGAFDQVSFVNGINTLRGGKHVDSVVNQITKKLADMVQQKKKKDVKQQHLRDNMMVFIKSMIVNPSFDSQTKETLTTQPKDFGSKCDLSDKFIEKLYKVGIVEKATALTDFHESKKLTKTDGKKQVRILVPGLDDANKAGTKESEKCTLILTEGLSAKSMAIAGLSVVGRDYYGVFPLKGKLLNVHEIDTDRLSKNEELNNLKKILGLEHGKTYSDRTCLRYGKVMALTDSDVDGSHIKGLLFNYFNAQYPSLFSQDDFLVTMLTPIVKVSKNKIVKSFYNLPDYEEWKRSEEVAGTMKGWEIKYYKGLGTSTTNEAKDYFKEMQLVNYQFTGKPSQDAMDLAFNKKRADDRKQWLASYDRSRVLDIRQSQVPFEDFVHKELIHFSQADLERSIAHMCDGLKTSQRKILYACLKRHLFNKEIKVAQLAGNVSEVSAYHHGEASLQQAIIGLAQDYVGANNVPLLDPIGQFGSRIQGGSDAASPRYIFTKLTELTRKLFREEDLPILNYLDDDGYPVEPDFYIPVLPLVLLNGQIGIGTGYSMNIPAFNPMEVANMCRSIVSALRSVPEQTSEALISTIAHANVLPSNILPWYLGYKGTIDAKTPTSNVSTGCYRWVDDTTIEVSELPVHMSMEDFKSFLEGMLADASGSSTSDKKGKGAKRKQADTQILKEFIPQYTEKHPRFILKVASGLRDTLDVVDTFKLSSTSRLLTSNMNLFNRDGVITHYDTVLDIVRDWAQVRIAKYVERKSYQLSEMERRRVLLDAKVRFIQGVVDGAIAVSNRPISELEQQLESMGFPKLSQNDAAVSYDYLTDMPIRQLTREQKERIENQLKKLLDEIAALSATRVEDIWAQEIDEFVNVYDDYSHQRLAEYDDGFDAPASSSTKRVKKTTAPSKSKK